MTGSDEQERERVVAAVVSHGWFHARTTRKGYYIMRCSCGEHQETLHKTPSNPRHFAQKLARMISQCSNQ